MKILVTGSSGLIGAALVSDLLRDGETVCRLMRPESAASPTVGGIAVPWNSTTGEIGKAASGADAIIHLAGESLVNGRWSAERKALLRSSRVETTRKLVEGLARLTPPPKALLSASAVGYYGNCGDETLTEESKTGHDFPARLAEEWEAEAAKAESLGMRVVRLRIGVVLAKHGGALRKMLLPFRLGLGGRLGSGRQWMSWLTLAEAVSIIRFALANDGVRGALNVVAPQPVRNAEFTRELARALHRPAILPAPAFALRLAMGEMAEAILLAGQRVLPQKLEKFGYRFLHPDLASALAAVLSPI